MATRIIRIPAFDAEIEWDEVEEKPTEFTPEHHEHEWVDILNEPEFAPATHAHSQYAPATHDHSEYSGTSHTHSNYAQTSHTHSEYAGLSHTHPMNQITGQLVTNYDPPIGNRPLLSWVNAGTDTNGPDDLLGWSVFSVPWADQTLSYYWQIGARYQDNPQGLYWRQTKNLANQPWWRIWDERNLLIASGNWTPILTVNNGAALTYTTQTGSFVRQGKMCHLSFDLVGRLEEGSSSPNNAISINSNTNSLPFLPAKAAATPIKFFTGNLAHKIAATAGSNLLVFYRYQVSGANIIEAAYTWTNLLANSLTFQISGNISYEIA